jgi:hypothetical protein
VQDQQNPLSRARLRRGLSLTDIRDRTRLSPRVLRILDEGRFAELPGGLYARGYVRAYAVAAGLDPDRTVEELSPQLPAAHDPLPMMRANARVDDPAWLTAVEDAQASAGAWLERMAATIRRQLPTRELLKGALLDGSMLVVLQAVLTLLTAGMCGIGVQSLLTTSGAAVAAVWGMQVSLYFALVFPVRRTRSGVLVRVPQIHLSDALSFRVHQSRHA